MNCEVLMRKTTGDLFEAVPVIYFEYPDPELIPTSSGACAVSIVPAEPAGWLLFNPRMAPYSIFFNKEGVEEFFENLGEL